LSVGLVGEERPEDDVGESALEDAEGFEAAVTVGPSTSVEVDGGRVHADLGDRDAV
jgi:hypothetical protein